MRLLIADDEQPARQRLRELLAEIDPAIEVVAEAGDGQAALDAVTRLQPQVVLLDIRMPGLDGIQAALLMAQQALPPAVIFVTAYDEHALAAFDAHAIDYLLKPIRASRLQQALARAQAFSQAQHQALRQLDEGEAALSATLGGKLQRIPLSEVIYLRADQKYVEIAHRHGLALIDQSLKWVEETFPGRFLRIHRNALVNPQCLRELSRDGEGRMLLGLDGAQQPLEVSRRHLAEVRRLLKG